MRKPVKILLALIVNFFFAILPIGYITYVAWSNTDPFRQHGPAFIDRAIEVAISLALTAFLVYLIWHVFRTIIKIR